MNLMKIFTKRLTKNIMKTMTKEDPAKIRAFLTDIANDQELPAEVRTACQKLLDGMETGKPLEEVMQDETKKSIEILEQDLKGGN